MKISLMIVRNTLVKARVFYFAKNQFISKNIKYEDIEKVEFPSIKYTGGWVKIIHKNGNIRLTVVLENIGDFLYELKNILDSKGKSDVYKEEKIFNFFKTASFSDEGWERLYDNIKFLLGIYYFNSITTVLILFFTEKQEIDLIMTMISIFAPFIGYMISEIIIGNRVRKRVIEGEYKLKPRDAQGENKMIRKYIIITTAIYILGAVAYKIFL